MEYRKRGTGLLHPALCVDLPQIYDYDLSGRAEKKIGEFGIGFGGYNRPIRKFESTGPHFSFSSSVMGSSTVSFRTTLQKNDIENKPAFV